MISIQIAIPTYNHGEYICDAIDSVISQSFRDWQLHVVDNNSSDSTIQSIRSKYSKLVDSRKIIINSFNKTVPVMQNFNRCLDLLVPCKYFKILCSDDILDKDYLKNAYDKLESLPENYVAYSCAINNFHNSTFINKREYGKYIFNIIFESVFFKNQIGCPSSLFFSYSAYKNIRFNESNNYSGDLLFFINPLVKKNKKIFLDKRAFVKVRMHSASNTSKNFMKKIFFKERYNARYLLLNDYKINNFLIHIICISFYLLEKLYGLLCKLNFFKH